MLSTRALASRTRRTLLGIRPRDAEPYATHLPVLIALARVVTVRRVLELGSGPFSTGLLLDRTVFPEVEHLVSYEDDRDWITATAHVAADPRLDFRLVSSVRSAVPDDLTEFDLIFVDDSRTVAQRSETLAAIGSARSRGLIVMHDFEQRGYRSAARRAGLDRLHVFKVFTPQVGILASPRSDFSHLDLDAIERVLDDGCRAGVPVTDRAAWVRLASRI